LSTGPFLAAADLPELATYIAAVYFASIEFGQAHRAIPVGLRADFIGLVAGCSSAGRIVNRGKISLAIRLSHSLSSAFRI